MQYVPTLDKLPGQFIETAIQQVIALMQQRFNSELDKVIAAYNPTHHSTINIPKIQPDRYYLSEVIEPLQPPAVFVIADNSENDLVHAQNFEHTTHELTLVILIEDIEIGRLTRSIFRMAIAAYRTLHDQNYNNMHLFVRGTNYSPAYARNADPGSRNFRKDVALRLEAHMYESF